MGDAGVGLMRNLGRFLGHVMAGVTASPGAAAPREVRRTVETESREDGVVLRRTVIEEVDVPRGRARTDERSADRGTDEHHAS